MKRSLQFYGNLLLVFSFFIAWHSLPAQIITILDPLSQTKFVNPLPFPSTLEPSGPGANHYEVTISQFEQDLGLKDHSGNPLMTTVWGYNGSYPGPTIEAFRDREVNVTWINELEYSEHLFPVVTYRRTL